MGKNTPKKKANNKGKSLRNPTIIAIAIGVLLTASLIVATLEGKNSNKTPTTNPTPTPSISSSAPPTQAPIPRSTTAAETAQEAPNVPSTPAEKTYFTCLSTSFNITTPACKSAEAIVSKESNVFGSNMADKFKYQISQARITQLRDILVQDIGANKIVVNGIDYFPKKGVRIVPDKGVILLYPGAHKIPMPQGVTTIIYSDTHVGINFCLSSTSFDGKVTWKVNLTSPNIYLGTPCSAKSLTK